MMKRPGLALWTGLAAFGIAGVFYWLQSDVRFDWADEGYLWYGVIHARMGEVPLRDFQSYDPGRYYWCVAWSYLFGTGILALRLACSLFQGFCLWSGLLALSRLSKNFWFLTFSGILSVLWMFWQYRYFDSGIPLVAVWIATRLLEKPSLRRHFQSGLAAGLFAFFGLNHGLYAGGGLVLLSFYCGWKKLTSDFFRAQWFLIMGLLVGLVPFGIMSLIYQGFGAVYRDLLGYSAERLSRGFNDMKKDISQFSWARQVLAASLSLYVGYACAALIFFTKNPRKLIGAPVLGASLFIGIPYCHQLFLRGTPSHVGESFFPFLAMTFALALILNQRNMKGLALFCALWATSLTLAIAVPLGTLHDKLYTPRERQVDTLFGKDKIWLDVRQAALLEGVTRCIQAQVPETETLLIAPMMAGVYCLTNKTSPVWELYFYLPQSEAVQEEAILALERKKVRWAILGDVALDGRADRRLLVTHPMLWNYFMDNFKPVSVSGLPEGYRLFKRDKFL